MDFATAHHRKQQARAVHEPIEFPKWIKVDGKDVLALNAEHEMELLTEPAEGDHPAFVGLPTKPSGTQPEASNLLSAPEKREQTTPRIVRKG